MNKLEVLHVVAGIDPAHGGPSYSVPRLCMALRDVGTEARIATVRGTDEQQLSLVAAYSQDFARVPVLREMRLSSELDRSVRHAATAVDLLHVHGLWLMPNVSAGRAARVAARPLIVSPRGMVSAAALAFSPVRKRVFWALAQGPAYASAAAWHATSEAEAQDIRQFGIAAPIAILPNGVDIPPPAEASAAVDSKPRTLLYLGRIHPKKGLIDLLMAWSRLAGERPSWRLSIIGPDEGGHATHLEATAKKADVPRVTISPAVYGEDKLKAFREADLFVLPTQNENFGIAVAEALAAGVPAIVSQGAPWSGLESERCGWWVAQGVEPLLAALRSATSLPHQEQEAMGRRGRAWMMRDFGWENIARQMDLVYRWLSGRADRPANVRTD